MSEKKEKQKNAKAKKKEPETSTKEDDTLDGWINKVIFLILGGFLLWYIIFFATGKPIEEDKLQAKPLDTSVIERARERARPDRER